jgi:superfamily II DNA/RNA helicase
MHRHQRPAARHHSRFLALGVPRPIDDVLAAQSITEPFPIQQATLPDALAGRDVLGRATTGSGKTLAFAIPVVARLASTSTRSRAKHPRALILVPTRELAAQVAAVVAPLATATALTCATVYGGVSQSRQVTALNNGADIVIACPGRLEDLIRQRACSLDDVEITVLDEADHMADLGFLPAVRRLLAATPQGGQRLLFSATLDSDIDSLVAEFTDGPAVHHVAAEAASRPVEHHVLSVEATEKLAVVRDIAARPARSMLFTRTKHGARKLTKQLTASGIAAYELHGDLSQAARERNLAKFAGDRNAVLVATDVAARGIHVDHVDLVVHVDPPAEAKSYLHRSGRTARAGAPGVVAIVATPQQTGAVRKLTRDAGVTVTTTKVSVGHPQLAALGARRSSAPEKQVPNESRRTRRRERREQPTTTGTVKFFNARKGYGFINHQDGRELFVHFSNIDTAGHRSLREGQHVVFEIGRGRNGDEATRVRVV